MSSTTDGNEAAAIYDEFPEYCGQRRDHSPATKRDISFYSAEEEHYGSDATPVERGAEAGRVTTTLLQASILGRRADCSDWIRHDTAAHERTPLFKFESTPTFRTNANVRPRTTMAPAAPSVGVTGDGLLTQDNTAKTSASRRFTLTLITTQDLEVNARGSGFDVVSSSGTFDRVITLSETHIWAL
ncbi:MAG: hypothetical protein KGO02_25525 [Alphaproteobacteria bacterium]|nr:hypothetical protein [Alphaproteobacteria bacterium]